MNTTQFDGKTAIVTAAASGIGRGIADLLVARGCRVLATDVDIDRLAEMQRSAPDPDLVSIMQCDVTDEQQVAAAVQRAAEPLNRLDVAVNVAGMGRGGMITDIELEDWEFVQRVTLRSTFLGIKHQARRMLADGHGGAIVNITSINALTAAEHTASYNAAKAGVVSLTKTAAIELGKAGIRVNAVGPGLVDTAMTRGALIDVEPIAAAYRQATPLTRHGEPIDIATAVLFLASDEAAWITGQTLFVDGGQTITGYPKIAHLVEGIEPSR